MREVPAGLVVVDKPAGMTSHDVVSRVRRLAGTRKVGHAGTLDPMATGVLVLGLERATRLLGHLTLTDKRYAATIRLGVTTTTDDAEGEVVETRSTDAVTEGRVRDALASYVGEIDQVPSSVSAIKVGGKRSYARVRSGEHVQLAARPVTVHRFTVLARSEVLDDGHPALDLDVEVDVSSGTYVRALARDLGQRLGVGGHLTTLRRTRVGPYGLDLASTLDQLAERFTVLSPAEAAAAVFPVRTLTTDETTDLRHGKRVSASGQGEGPVAALDPGGELVALLEDRGPQARSLLVVPPG